MLVRAKTHAARTGRTLTALIEDALKLAMGMREGIEFAKPYEVRTFASTLNPGVDLDDNSALLELMDHS
ncbi:hypothetical protein BH23ACT12_BH23ACT12_23290 [soil metagenome]